MIELWSTIPSFENYSISNYGAVLNGLKGNYLATYQNQSRTVYVQLWREGKAYNRAVAPLVAAAFLGAPPHPSWDTPIHLNGNRADLFVENLMWRPRWFAMDYHHQIWTADSNSKVRDLQSKEIASVKDFCMKYGLLPSRVWAQAVDHINSIDSTFGVWPTGQMFEFV